MAIAIRIDKNVPIPEKFIPGKGNHGSVLDFLKDLQVGDSVFLKTSKKKAQIKTGNFFRTTSVASYIHRMSKLVGMKWVYRTRTENDVVGIRVWRTT
mgnify:CR=1 FL=1